MMRTIEQWMSCNPATMASNQSENAQFYAFSDAKADILELYEKLEKAKLILRRIAYPKRNTADVGMDAYEMAEMIQREFPLEELE